MDFLISMFSYSDAERMKGVVISPLADFRMNDISVCFIIVNRLHRDIGRIFQVDGVSFFIQKLIVSRSDSRLYVVLQSRRILRFASARKKVWEAELFCPTVYIAHIRQIRTRNKS